MKNSKLIPNKSGQNSKLRKFTICNLQFAIYNSRRAGFTLIELMIAITITVLAMAAVYTSFIVQQRSFTTQDQVAETELSSKIGFDMLINDIRDAGFGYPAEKPPVNSFTESIYINPTPGVNGSDILTLVGGFRRIAALQNATTVGSDQIMINYTGSTEFNQANRSNLSIEGLTFATITNCTLVGGNCSGAAVITLDRDIDKPIPAGRPVYLVEDVTYQIVTATGTNCNNAPVGTTCLTRSVAGGGAGNVDTIANNIDDFQIADCSTQSPLSSCTSTGNYLIVSLLARTAAEDQTLDPNTKPYPTGIILEDQTTAVGAGDRFRRRIWSMKVAWRNSR